MSESSEMTLSEKYAEHIESGTGEVEVADLESGGIKLLQSRADMSHDTVADYSALMTGGKGRGNTPAEFPPVRVYYVETEDEMYLTAGNHRWHAAEQAGKLTLDAEFIIGSKQDAVLDSVSSNATHGLRPSAKDVEASLALLFEHAKYRRMSDRHLSRIIGCSPTTIGKGRKALSTADSADNTRVDSNGRKLNTANIGKTKKRKAKVDDECEAPVEQPEDEQPDVDDDATDEEATAPRPRFKLPDDPTEGEIAEVEAWLEFQDERQASERFKALWSACNDMDKLTIADLVKQDIVSSNVTQ